MLSQFPKKLTSRVESSHLKEFLFHPCVEPRRLSRRTPVRHVEVIPKAISPEGCIWAHSDHVARHGKFCCGLTKQPGLGAAGLRLWCLHLAIVQAQKMALKRRWTVSLVQPLRKAPHIAECNKG